MVIDRFVPVMRSRAVGRALLLALVVGCGGGSQAFAPSSPEAAVEGFLSAVKANSLVAMGELWGTSSGPMAGRMDRDELEKRLTVIRVYLAHDQYEIVPAGARASAAAPAGARAVHARLTRGACRPVVPFTVVPFRQGWLVSDVDLNAAGNPARPCGPVSRGSR